MAESNPWRTLSSRIAYRNEWISVREDEVIRPDGGRGIYGVIEIRPSVGVVALNASAEIALVRQWRYTSGRCTLEIPRGGSSDADTSMLDAARRELREECGYAASSWTELGSVDVCNGVTTDVQHLFVATGLTWVGTHQEAVEQIATEWRPFGDAVRMALTGEITEVCSVAAILRYSGLFPHSGANC
ncbi:MAG TPA: NUDIX hydrolase [Bryobacteraceae bacterium]|nr:NUDIX hydrolase [Bryobacteraceae bacterium]